MKTRRIQLIICIILLFAVVLSGCNLKNEGSKPHTDETNEIPENDDMEYTEIVAHTERLV